MILIFGHSVLGAPRVMFTSFVCIIVQTENMNDDHLQREKPISKILLEKKTEVSGRCREAQGKQPHNSYSASCIIKVMKEVSTVGHKGLPNYFQLRRNTWLIIAYFMICTLRQV
jgi:hypothetical protein